MFTSDIKSRGIKSKENFNGGFRKTVLVYLILALVSVFIDQLYALFGHGVRSAAMTWMCLYPLIGGALIYLLLHLLIPEVKNAAGFRFAFNIYNSGIATLTAGSFLKGILEIAGADSPYTAVFPAVGWIFIAAGISIFFLKPLRNHAAANRKTRVF